MRLGWGAKAVDAPGVGAWVRCVGVALRDGERLLVGVADAVGVGALLLQSGPPGIFTNVVP